MNRTSRLQRRTPLSSGKPLERRTPLHAATTLARVTPLALVSRKRRAENRERRTVVHATFGDAPTCAVPDCGRPADDVHEPLTRAR
ncbi:hypothetical protein, partial [Actinomadura sp. CNU-125]|uniref:hypothetical protein n=1 Tax=Actinomadura sp. CNU-125 TaxID=1904961 RepID=UPI0021CCF53B